jgi:hypothetical protein
VKISCKSQGNTLFYKEKRILVYTKCSIFVLEGVLPWLETITSEGDPGVPVESVCLLPHV